MVINKSLAVRCTYEVASAAIVWRFAAAVEASVAVRELDTGTTIVAWVWITVADLFCKKSFRKSMA